METNSNPGLGTCTCHPQKKGGVVLLDFESDQLRQAQEGHKPGDLVEVAFRGETHTFDFVAARTEVRRRFLNQLRGGK